ncbi:MAG: hypothetical protein RRZ42_08300 [Oscillospiraceae bacterium]
MFSFKGFNESMLTFPTDSKIETGVPVKISTDSKAVPCATTDTICGVIAASSIDAASVQLSGYVELPYTGTAPTFGYTNICANAGGGVTVGGSHIVLVIKVDTTAKICGFIL